MRHICLTVIAAVACTLTGCVDRNHSKAEIVGIAARAGLDEITSGNLKDLAYGGELAVQLPDGKRVLAACPRELLSQVKGCPQFSTEEAHSGIGIVASITIGLKEKQKALLVRKQPDQWEVAEVLK